MAWLDNRVWCHPKLVSVSYKARWTWVAGVTYSNGFETLGRLTAGQQKAIGSDAKVRRELVDVGLWDEDGDGAIVVHDWAEHNSERDERRAAARERKRQQRERDKARDNERDKEQMSRVTSVTGSVTKRVTSRTRVRAPDDGSEGSEGSTRSKPSTPASLKPADSIWDFVAEIEGEPLPRYKAARGRIVSDLRELVRYLPADRQVPELRLRHEALCREWGDAKATSRALVQHFVRAGRMANGESRPPQPKDERFFNADELYKRAQASQLAQKGAPELESG